MMMKNSCNDERCWTLHVYVVYSTSTMILWCRLVRPVVRIDMTEYEKTEI